MSDDGAYAPSSFEARQGGRLVASGSCASPATLPAGTYDVTLTLESALDRPTRHQRVVVPENGAASARASFQTAILEVRFTNDRQPVPGIAFIQKDGVQVGTLGSGVSARVSPGTYQIVARSRTHEQSYTVQLVAGQRRAVRASF